MLNTGNVSKNPRNKPTSNLSKKLNNNLSHHPHPLPDPLLKLVLLILKLQMPKPDLLQLNHQNWQVNLTQRENLLPKSIKIVCIVVELAINLVTALMPKRLKRKLWLFLSLVPKNQRIWPQNRKKAERSTNVDTRGGLRERLCRCISDGNFKCSQLSKKFFISYFVSKSFSKFFFYFFNWLWFISLLLGWEICKRQLFSNYSD